MFRIIQKFKDNHGKIYYILLSMLLFCGTCFFVLILSFSYFYFYPNNFFKYINEYNFVSKKLTNLGLDIRLNENNCKSEINKFNDKLSITDKEIICNYISKIDLQEVVVSNIGMATFTLKKVFWSSMEFNFVFYKDGFEHKSRVFPFYTKHSDWMFEKQINDNWVIIRPNTKKYFYPEIKLY